MPQTVQTQQNGGGIGTATPQPATHRHAFAQADFDSEAAAAGRLQGARRPDRQVSFRVDAGQRVAADDPPVFAQRQVDGVAEIEQAKQRLQRVIAVVTPSGDVQKQVELGWCW